MIDPMIAPAKTGAVEDSRGPLDWLINAFLFVLVAIVAFERVHGLLKFLIGTLEIITSPVNSAEDHVRPFLASLLKLADLSDCKLFFQTLPQLRQPGSFPEYLHQGALKYRFSWQKDWSPCFLQAAAQDSSQLWRKTFSSHFYRGWPLYTKLRHLSTNIADCQVKQWLWCIHLHRPMTARFLGEADWTSLRIGGIKFRLVCSLVCSLVSLFPTMSGLRSYFARTSGPETEI